MLERQNLIPGPSSAGSMRERSGRPHFCVRIAGPPRICSASRLKSYEFAKKAVDQISEVVGCYRKAVWPNKDEARLVW